MHLTILNNESVRVDGVIAKIKGVAETIWARNKRYIRVDSEQDEVDI